MADSIMMRTADIPVNKSAHPRGAGDVLTVSFSTVIAMWAVGYAGRMPAVMAPSWAVGAEMLLCLIGGGLLAGWTTGRGWRGGLFVGLLAGCLNLLVFGSMLHGPAAANA